MDAAAEFVIDVLKIVGGAIALLALVVLFVGSLKSIWNVTFGRAILVLPFNYPGESKVWVSGLLSEHLEMIEEEWATLKQAIDDELALGPPDNSAQLLDTGRTMGSESSGLKKDQVIAPKPSELQAIGQINLAGTSFSPESIFILLDLIRTKFARHLVTGQVDELVGVVRLSATYKTWKGSKRFVNRVEGDVDEKIEGLVTDLAFQISKIRTGDQSSANTWEGYRTFLKGYLHHLQYQRSEKEADRDAALTDYERSVEIEPGFNLASYNLGLMRYALYTAEDNAKAILHFESASKSPRKILRALSLAGLAKAYCQKNHRFGEKGDEWLRLAEKASGEAVRLSPELDEANLAFGFTMQSLTRNDQARRSYRKVLDLEDESKSFLSRLFSLQSIRKLIPRDGDKSPLKSIALNNLGYLYLKQFDDPETAEDLLKQSLVANSSNKMAHANLGAVHQRQKKFEQADQDFRNATTTDPGYVNGFNEWGILGLAKARSEMPDGAWFPEVALEYHRKALSLIPDNEDRYREVVRANFIAALIENGFEEEADKMEKELL